MGSLKVLFQILLVPEESEDRSVWHVSNPKLCVIFCCLRDYITNWTWYSLCMLRQNWLLETLWKSLCPRMAVSGEQLCHWCCGGSVPWRWGLLSLLPCPSCVTLPCGHYPRNALCFGSLRLWASAFPLSHPRCPLSSVRIPLGSCPWPHALWLSLSCHHRCRLEPAQITLCCCPAFSGWPRFGRPGLPGASWRLVLGRGARSQEAAARAPARLSPFPCCSTIAKI